MVVETFVEIVRSGRLGHGDGNVAPQTTQLVLDKRIQPCFERREGGVDLGLVCLEEGLELMGVDIR